jgi:uncharacterized protein (DUF4415 family)
MSRKENDAASRPDEDNPEWTCEQICEERPVLQVIAEKFGPGAAQALRRGGRPSKPNRKVNQTLRLDPDVLEAYRGEGPGWQALMNDVLRQHMPRHDKS